MGDYALHLITQAWVEGEADWNNASEDKKWSEAGGDYVSDAVDELTVGREDGERWISYDVLEAVKSFVANPEENYGFLLRNSFLSQEMDVASSEYEDSELRPKLTVELTPSAASLPQPKVPAFSLHKQVTIAATGNRMEIINNSGNQLSVTVARLNGTRVSTQRIAAADRKALSVSGAGVYLISVHGNNFNKQTRITLLP